MCRCLLLTEVYFRTILRLLAAAAFVAVPSSLVHGQRPQQVPCTEWSAWYQLGPVAVSWQTCQTEQLVEVRWKWQNTTASDLEFSYWVHLRDPAGCVDKVRGSVAHGEHNVAAGTTEAGTSGYAMERRDQVEGTWMCVAFGGGNERQPESVTLPPGTRVRLSMTTPSYAEFEGEVIGFEPVLGRLSVKRSSSHAADTVVSVSLHQIRCLAVSPSEATHAKRGMITGAFAGGLIGGVIGALAYDRECHQASWHEAGNIYWAWRCTGLPPVARGLVVGLVSGVVGGGIGYLIGSKISADSWQAIPVDRLRAALGPTERGSIGLALSITF
jgi:hypothetical protein